MLTRDQCQTSATPFPRPAQRTAAHRAGDRTGKHRLPLRPRDHGQDRRGSQRAARYHAGPVAGDRHHPPALRLPEGTRWRDPGPGAGATHSGRAADRGAHRSRDRVQVFRAPAALPPGPDLRPPRRCDRTLNLGRLGGACRFSSGAYRRADGRVAQTLQQTVHGRNHRSGPRSGTRQDQDRLSMGAGA